MNTQLPSLSSQAIVASRPASRRLYRFEAQLTYHPVGLVPEGLRMANSFEGRVTEGNFVGARVWGVDQLLIRPDGVAVIDAPKTISLGDLHIYEHVRGYCLPPEGLEMPPLAAMLDPDFAWPDLLFPIIGASSFRVGAPELDYLNRSFATIEGYANYGTGGLAIETSLVEHAGAAAGPSSRVPVSG